MKLFSLLLPLCASLAALASLALSSPRCASENRASLDAMQVLADSPCVNVLAEEEHARFSFAVVRHSKSSPVRPVVLVANWRDTPHAPQPVGEKAVTLVTHGTPDRLANIRLQAERWQGPVAASILVCSRGDLQKLKADWPSNVAVTLVVGDFSAYPVNLMRNVAVWSTFDVDADDFVLVLDADAIPNQSMRHFMDDVTQADLLVDAQTAAAASSTVAIVPAFNVSLNTTTVPELLDALAHERAAVMHAGRPSYAFDWVLWGAGHHDIEYTFMSEPYVVAAKRLVAQTHVFDERFLGRGFNKQSLHFEWWAAGVRRRSLRTSFIADVANVVQTPLGIAPANVEHWRAFRSEVAARYNLDCSQAQWRRCDTHGMCARVCSRPLTPDVPPLLAQRGQTGNDDDAFWSAFVQRLDNEAASKPARWNRSECSQVDFVFTWVNGSEPAHREQRRAHIPADAFAEAVDLGNGRRMRDHELEFRFRDFGRASTLYFAIKLVLKHAPWVRTVWVVTADQTPSFLLGKEFDNARVKLVAHADIFARADAGANADAACLPTFNSCAIEVNLHRIPGLAPCYMYANDDTLLLRDIAVDDYWPANEPAPRAVFDGSLVPALGLDPWQRKLANVGRLLQSEFPTMSWNSVFTVGHTGHFFVKAAVAELERALKRDFDRTRCEKWRTEHSLWVPLAYSNWLAHVAPARAKRESGAYVRLVDGKHAVRNVRKAVDAAVASKATWLCLNDIMGPVVPDEFIDGLYDVLSAL